MISFNLTDCNHESIKIGSIFLKLKCKGYPSIIFFYEKMGFAEFGGDISQNWLILKNGNTIIWLFQGMFEKNRLTFNPGWDENANEVDSFDDIRAISIGISRKMESNRRMK